MKAADMETTLEVLTFTCLLVQKYKY